MQNQCLSYARTLVGALLTATVAMSAQVAWAAAQGPTDLFLLRVHSTGGGLVVDSVSRLTNRDGYDNQPAFLADGSGILYTSIDAAGQADIYRIDLSSRASSRVTRTAPESEYSATPMPGHARFSAIRVEADSAQRLWSFDMTGDNAAVVLENVRPVGYHAWIDENRLALFVLGSPATLQLADVRDGSSREIARDIGRSVHRVPGGTTVSFVHRDGASGPGWIKILDPSTGTMRPIIQPFPENEYHVWMPDGLLLTARGSVLFALMPGTDTDWVRVADLAASGIADISRLAVSPDGRSIVVVAVH